MTQATRLLLVEDSHDDAYILQRLLKEKLPPAYEVLHVKLLSTAIGHLRVASFDTVLLDLTLPDSAGLKTLAAVLEVAPDLPVIVLTAWEDEETADRALQHGAQDFLVKGKVDGNLLRRSIKYAIERCRLEKERNELGRQLLEVVADEQLRIGQELHDGIGQGLGGLSMMSQSLARKLAALGLTEAKSAEAISQGIHNLLIELHNMLRGLIPVDLEQTALTIALEHLCETVTDQSGIACVYEGDEKADVENPDTALHLYRIAQEAIHNAIRHGNPTRLGVRLLKEGGAIVLEIEDNGSGFNAEAPNANGMGLRIMQHRSRLIGATLEVKSVEKKGTTVRCKYGSGELTHEHQPEE